VFYSRGMHSTVRPAGSNSWQATVDMPSTLVAALYLRDACGLEVVADVAVPPLEPGVQYDGALVPYATGQAAAAWGPWWDGLLERHPEFRGVPPLVPDPFPELPVDLRALIGVGLPGAEAWFDARKREDIEVIRREGRPRMPAVGEVVGQVEGELGRAAAPFDLLISVLPVTGLWGRRARRDHVLVSRALAGHDAGFAAFLEPVVRDLAA
jgi:hypothetical protein